MKTAVKALYAVVILQIFSASAAVASEQDSSPPGFSRPSNTAKAVTVVTMSALLRAGGPKADGPSIMDTLRGIGALFGDRAAQSDALANPSPPQQSGPK
jgi:hypothetical protein